jgi:glutaredoxin-like protein NrdH
VDFHYKEKKMITLYSKPNCPFCDNAKVWFERNDIPYTVIDITQNDEALNFIKSKGHKTVPQIYLKEEIFVEGGYTGLTKQDPVILKEKLGYKEAA